MRIVNEYRRPVLIAWRIAFWFYVFVFVSLLASAVVVLPGFAKQGDLLSFGLAFGSVGLLSAGSVAWLWVFLARKDQAWRKIEEALGRHGVEVDAEIVAKEFQDLQEASTYSVTYRFHPEFSVVARDGSLNHKLFDLAVGSKVRVRYLPGQPELSQLVWPVPARER
jgi:hypothetical protein